MIFIKNKKIYPRHIGDIQEEFPSWEPGDLLPVGWEIVEATEPPQSSVSYRVVEAFPNHENGKWYQAWRQIPITNADRTRYDTVDPGELPFQNPEL